MNYKCLSIGGFDGSGGAGIQADLKTFSALGCYGMTILTALPVQNTCGVRALYPLPIQAIEDQLYTIFEDITPDSIKIGMLFSEEIIGLVSDFLIKHASSIPLVVDPVMMSKNRSLLLRPEAIGALKEKIIPLATLITPNLPEAYNLTGTRSSFEQLAQDLLKFGSQAVLLKGGHADTATCDDLFLDQNNSQWLKSERIDSKNTHGTGCTLSAAICALLAQNYSNIEACKMAKQYLFEAILRSKDHSVGKGQGPVHHFYHVWPLLNRFFEQ